MGIPCKQTPAPTNYKTAAAQLQGLQRAIYCPSLQQIIHSCKKEIIDQWVNLTQMMFKVDF